MECPICDNIDIVDVIIKRKTKLENVEYNQYGLKCNTCEFAWSTGETGPKTLKSREDALTKYYKTKNSG